MTATTNQSDDPASRIREVRVIAEDGRAIGVRVLPFRSRTILVILDVDNYPWFFAKSTLPPTTNAWVHEVADFTASNCEYDWDTPRYRELCIAGGLDPDHHRPRFAPDDMAAGTALVRVISQVRNGLSHDALDILLDLIDLMRIDGWRAHVSQHDLKRRFRHLTEQRPDVAEEVMTVMQGVVGTGSMEALLTR